MSKSDPSFAESTGKISALVSAAITSLTQKKIITSPHPIPATRTILFDLVRAATQVGEDHAHKKRTIPDPNVKQALKKTPLWKKK